MTAPSGGTRQGPFPSLTAEVVAGSLAGVLGSALIAVLLAVNADRIADLTLNANPTCASPRGLHEVTGLEATGFHETDPADPDPNDPTAEGGRFDDSYAVDDARQSLWVPPLVTPPPMEAGRDFVGREPRFDVTNDRNVLEIRLPEAEDIKLVCVVSGSTQWWITYQNLARVRTIEIWGHDDDDHQLGTLQSLGSDDFPNAQLAARNVGTTDVVHVKLVDAYSGHRVETFNAKACLGGATKRGSSAGALQDYLSKQEYDLASDTLHRYEPGCLLEPRPWAGLGAVYLYAKD